MFKSPPYIGHDSFATANAVTLSSIASVRRIAKTLLVRFISGTPFVFRKTRFSRTPDAVEKQPRIRIYVTAKIAANNKFTTHTTDAIPLPALPLRLNVDRVIRPLARSFRRVASPGQYAFSLWLFSCRCDSSYWDGRRPAGFLKGGSPALCSRAESGPCVCDAQ